MGKKRIRGQLLVHTAVLTFLIWGGASLSSLAGVYRLDDGCELSLSNTPANDNAAVGVVSPQNVIAIPLSQPHRFHIVISAEVLLNTVIRHTGASASLHTDVHPMAGAFLQALENLKGRIHILSPPSSVAIQDTWDLLNEIELPDGRFATDLIELEDIHAFEDVTNGQAALVPGQRNVGPFEGRRKIDLSRLPGIPKELTVVLTSDAQQVPTHEEISYLVLHANNRYQSHRGDAFLWGKNGGVTPFDIERLTHATANTNRFSLILGMLSRSLHSAQNGADFRQDLWKMTWRRADDGNSIEFEQWNQQRETPLVPNLPLHDDMDIYRAGAALLSETGIGPGFIELFDTALLQAAFEPFRSTLTSEQKTEIQRLIKKSNKVPPAKLLSGHVWQVVTRNQRLFEMFYELQTRGTTRAPRGQ